MSILATRITAELQSLVGKPLSDGMRAADMQMFGFGRLEKRVNRKGIEFQWSELSLHIQCRWRLVDGTRILFGRDDLLRPASNDVSVDDFDWDQDESALDVAQRDWIMQHSSAPLRVVQVTGDDYGGCRIELERHHWLELFPCNSDRGEYSEHWRLLGHRANESHFVVSGRGIEESSRSSEQ